jgi:hypothetical protein
MYLSVHVCTDICVRIPMAKRPPDVGGFRLNLREPLAGQLDEFCANHFRKKTEVIREALTAYFDSWADQQDKKRDG